MKKLMVYVFTMLIMFGTSNVLANDIYFKPDNYTYDGEISPDDGFECYVNLTRSYDCIHGHSHLYLHKCKNPKIKAMYHIQKIVNIGNNRYVMIVGYNTTKFWAYDPDKNRYVIFESESKELYDQIEKASRWFEEKMIREHKADIKGAI